MKYYEVVAKCGHVGMRKYIDVVFPVYANSKKGAAKFILQHGKVKKQLKNAITSIKEISYEEYVELLINNPFEEYIHAHSTQEIDYSKYEIKYIEKNFTNKSYFEFLNRKEKVNYKMKKNKIIKELFCYEITY